MNCMNEVCRRTTSSEWKKGWSLKSGGFATLCYNCGSAYEGSVFCEVFHLEESGWRECRICGKHIHCGCVASRNLHEFLDFGGVGCISCEKLETHSGQSVRVVPNGCPNATFITNGIKYMQQSVVDTKVDGATISTEMLLHLTNTIGSSDTNSPIEQHKREESYLQNQESIKHFPNFIKQCSSSPYANENNKPKQEVKDMYESLAQPSLGFSLASPLVNSIPLLAFPSGSTEASEQSKCSLQQGQSTRHFFPKPPKPTQSTSEMQKTTTTQKRYARPPADGRGRTQLLPRYWPRITDQELQQLSGDLKSSIVPLFEKILSASDAGRIGRLVLPKACAEAYFPPINQSEGIPIKIQDIKGKEWTFQFRFWPNNNSRMYVLEGVTPCIQNMQMQAGDTVTFSRRDPGGQLVIGCRKAINNIDEQDSQTPSILNGDSLGENLADNSLSNGGRMTDDSIQGYMLASEKKKMRNIKHKRLLMHTDDAFELRITWEEAQELLRPSPAAKSTIVMIEDQEFEEFDEPPIFGKRTIFSSQPSGEMEQLTQCDSCSKWRRLPAHALLSAKWTCVENVWDSNRCSCSAPEDIDARDLESVFGGKKDYKKRKTSDEKASKDGEPCGLDALATAAVLGDNIVEIGESSAGATTRHPRHRPGCTCIVCIQPPSGKGKHEPSCKCNVCLTVKRRFKTLMMRKKKRQSEREAEMAQLRGKSTTNIELQIEEFAGNTSLHVSHQENEINDTNMEESGKGRLDLNSDPHREDESVLGEAKTSLTRLASVASQPNVHFVQNRPRSLEAQCLPSRTPGEGEESGAADEADMATGDVEPESIGKDA